MSSWRVCAVIYGCLAILAGCTHDFDTFESANDQAGVTDGGSGEGGDACTVATVCTTNAKTCAGNCNQAETTCEGECGGGGGGGRTACKAGCADASVTCVASCVSACSLCSTCPAEAACQTAAN